MRQIKGKTEELKRWNARGLAVIRELSHKIKKCQESFQAGEATWKERTGGNGSEQEPIPVCSVLLSVAQDVMMIPESDGYK